MKHFSLLIILLLICIYIKGEEPFKIIGIIDDAKVDTVFFKYYRCEKDNWAIDTILVKNGTFSIEGKLSPFTDALLSINNKGILLFLDPGEMHLYLRKDSLDKFVLEGSQTQTEKEELETQTKPLESNLSNIKKQISSEQGEQNKDYLKVQQDSINDLLENIWIDFIFSRPDSHYSLRAISFLLFNKNQDIDLLTNLYNNLSESIKVSCKGKQIYNFILQRKKSLMTNVSSLQAFDKKGTLVKLSDFEGKYILVDFWASWCVPCIKGFSHLKELYAKYKDKGFVVINISVDRLQDEQKWLNAIEKNDINEWIQIISCKNDGENNMCDLHDFLQDPSIPHYILIDKSGNIIKQWRGFGDQVADEQNEMLNNFFENKK